MQTIFEDINTDIPLHQLAVDCQFRIFSLEKYSANKFAHRHDFYEILWIQQGEGNHLVDFSKYSLESNHIFFLKPGQINKFTSREMKGHVIDFNEAFFYQESQDKHILAKLHQTPHIKLVPENEAAISSLIELIYNEHTSKY
ncbi:MAG TPA: AraC family ligand binding domain-containing protein, partial [Coleofasciculaceae cyanobacterium]